MAKLDILDYIERKADGYAVINVLSNIAFQVASIYLINQAYIYIVRMLANPC